MKGFGHETLPFEVSDEILVCLNFGQFCLRDLSEEGWAWGRQAFCEDVQVIKLFWQKFPRRFFVCSNQLVNVLRALHKRSVMWCIRCSRISSSEFTIYLVSLEGLSGGSEDGRHSVKMFRSWNFWQKFPRRFFVCFNLGQVCQCFYSASPFRRIIHGRPRTTLGWL